MGLPRVGKMGHCLGPDEDGTTLWAKSCFGGLEGGAPEGAANLGLGLRQGRGGPGRDFGPGPGKGLGLGFGRPGGAACQGPESPSPRGGGRGVSRATHAMAGL